MGDYRTGARSHPLERTLVLRHNADGWFQILSPNAGDQDTAMDAVDAAGATIVAVGRSGDPANLQPLVWRTCV